MKDGASVATRNVLISLCLVTRAATNEPSAKFHNHGEDNYYCPPLALALCNFADVSFFAAIYNI